MKACGDNPLASVQLTVRQIKAAYWSWRHRCEAAEFALAERERQIHRLLERCEASGVDVSDIDLAKETTLRHAKPRRW
jgi:hypothetical protein